VEEALYLSTRILVLSPRPGRIIRDLAVPFEAGRDASLKLTPEFMRLKRELVDLLRHPREGSAEERGDTFRRLITDSHQTNASPS
jgi:NitT/TauT family transport system ATP-binding protein